MIEKIKSVNNPLTVIAIFAALAEIAGTIALGLSDRTIQQTYIWFVMAFPTLLVVLFFLTLNFNPKVLYAPGDFQNEENFLNIIQGKNQLLETIDFLNSQLEITKTQLSESSNLKSQRDDFKKLINEQIKLIQNQLQVAKESTEEIAKNTSTDNFPQSPLQASILKYLNEVKKPVSREDIVNNTRIGDTGTILSLERLFRRGLIIRTKTDSGIKYSLK